MVYHARISGQFCVKVYIIAKYTFNTVEYLVTVPPTCFRILVSWIIATNVLSELYSQKYTYAVKIATTNTCPNSSNKRCPVIWGSNHQGDLVPLGIKLLGVPNHHDTASSQKWTAPCCTYFLQCVVLYLIFMYKIYPLQCTNKFHSPVKW